MLFIYVLAMQTFSMFATDMYSPALPELTEFFHTSDSFVNLTFMVFFIFMLIGMMLFGPISDKYGRKPILMCGNVLFAVASLACGLAPNIEILVVARAFQAMAAGMIEVVGLALLKDCYDDQKRESVLLWVQFTFVVGPIAAPLVGAQILRFASWRGVFFVLCILGAAGTLMTLAFKESLPREKRMRGSVVSSFSGLVHVAKCKEFTTFMFVSLLFTALPFTAYLLAAPYVYENYFSLTPQQYSYMFGLTVALSVLGIPLYKLAKRLISLKTLTTVLILATGAAGVGMIFFAHRSYWAFLGFMLVFYFGIVISRPYSTNILLEMRPNDVGAASSVLNGVHFLVGIIGLLPVTILGGNYILCLSILIILGAVLSLMCWVYVFAASLKVEGIT